MINANVTLRATRSARILHFAAFNETAGGKKNVGEGDRVLLV